MRWLIAWASLVAACASPKPAAEHAPGSGAPRDRAADAAGEREAFVDRTRERLAREDKQRALDERRDEFMHRQNGRTVK